MYHFYVYLKWLLLVSRDAKHINLFYIVYIYYIQAVVKCMHDLTGAH